MSRSDLTETRQPEMPELSGNSHNGNGFPIGTISEEQGEAATQSQALGTFEIVSGSMIVSDPCYEAGLWCCNKLERVRRGAWEAETNIVNEAPWGKRVALRSAHHEAFDEAGCSLETADFDVGVDSGQAGFFDAVHYRDAGVFPDASDKADAEEWYKRCCQLTLSPMLSGVLPYGVVSASGYGDGAYECRLYRDQRDEIVRVDVCFIPDADEEGKEDESDA